MNIKKEDITASFVAEQLPEVAKALRAEGVASVKTEELVAGARKEERDQAEQKIAAAKVEGATAERDRIAKIQGLAMEGADELVAKAIAEGHTPEQFAMDQVSFLKKNAGKTTAKSALESGETIAGQVPATPVAGQKTQLTPAQQAKADAEALAAKGII